MLEYVESMITLLLGDYFFHEYEWAYAFREIALFFMAILIIVLAYKLWKFILIGWWR